MWKQNSQRFIPELDKLRSELLAEKKYRTSLQIELSEVHTQCNGLQQELDKVRLLIEEPREKQEPKGNALCQMEDKDNIKKEWEREMKFLKELNANLALQLKRSQEANLELISVLQEMEKQLMEINNLSVDKVEIEDMDTYSISSEDNKRTSLEDQDFPEDIQKEIQGSCVEETVAQLHEEPEANGTKGLKLQLHHLPEFQKNEKISPIVRKTLKKKIHESERGGALRTKGEIRCGVDFSGKFVENNRKKTSMNTKFSEDFYAQGLEGLCFENAENCSPFREIEVLKKKLLVLEQDHKELKEENIDLQSKLKKPRRNIQTCGHLASSFLMPDLNAVIKISELFSELYECFRISTTNERKRMHSPSLMASSDYKSNFSQMEGCENEGFYGGEKAEAIFNKFIQLKDLFEASFTLHEDVFKFIGEKPNPGVASPPQAKTKLKNGGVYDNPLCTGTVGVKNLHTEFRFNDTDSGIQNAAIDSLRHEIMPKDKEIEGLKHCKKELEAQIARIEEEKSQMEDDVTGSLGKNGVNPQVLANDIISKTLSKLKRENVELEVHLLELENENIFLSERVSGLEAVLRHLTDEKVSICLLLQDSQSNVGKLQKKVCELENDIITQKLDLKEKLQDRQQQFFEAQEESLKLKIENKKLQTKADSITEEHSLLQISNVELRKQKMDLQEHCAILEVELKATLELFSGILKEVENLEASFCGMLKEISLKEKFMNGELDALVREIHKHSANLARDDSLLNQMYLEKTAEVDNLERKVVHLMKQMSATFDETERAASEAAVELSCLREDKAMLEAALQEAQVKVRLCEGKIDLIHREADRKVLGVIGELAVSKQNQDILIDCYRKVSSSLENVRNSEPKLKNMLRRHELKLKASESDKQNLAEEVSALKIKLQKKEKLQDEVLALKKSLIESEHQNKCLKVSFEMLSEDYENLKAESVTYLEEISDMKKVESELGNYKRSKTALDEKVWRLEWELTAKEASCTLQSKMRNELARLTRTNSQLKWKIKYLEEEKEECFKRVQVLEEELKQHKEKMQNREESINRKLSCGSTCDNTQKLKDMSNRFSVLPWKFPNKDTIPY